jgi:hypothetical protein
MIDSAPTASPPSPDQASQARLFDPPLATAESSTNAAAMLEYAADLRRKRAQGGRMTPVEWKIIERCAFLEHQAVVWHDRATLAAEIKQLTGLTYNALDKSKCPWNAHGPTDKAPVYRWLVERMATDLAKARREAREAATLSAHQREREDAALRRLKAQADREEAGAHQDHHRYQSAAEDEARAYFLRICAGLRQSLLDDLPGRLAAALDGRDAAAREAILRDQLGIALATAVTTAGQTPPPKEPAP